MTRAPRFACPRCHALWHASEPEAGHGWHVCHIALCRQLVFYVAVPADVREPLLGWRPLPARTWLLAPALPSQRYHLRGQPLSAVLRALGLLEARAA